MKNDNDMRKDFQREMRRRRKLNTEKKGLGKEKITMLVTSVAVLGALTFTGIYMGQRSEQEQDGNQIDYSAIEEKAAQERAAQNQEDSALGSTAEDSASGIRAGEDGALYHDMDVDPDIYAEYKAANSGEVVNPGLTASGRTENGKSEDAEEEDSKNKEAEDDEDSEDGSKQEPEEQEESDTQRAGTASAAGTGQVSEESDTASASMSAKSAEAGSASVLTAEQKLEAAILEAEATLVFDESHSLAWPVVGNVLINYSMDGYVFFPTLGQYKYSPAIVIAAQEDTMITAAAAGVVSDVNYDEEIGNYVTMLLGSGYELTYGQLKNIDVVKGDYVETGDLIGAVAAPTKYYTLEGSNVYFRMTKDEQPVNPLTLLK